MTTFTEKFDREATICLASAIQYRSSIIRLVCGYAGYGKLNLWIPIRKFQFCVFPLPSQTGQTRAEITFSPEKWTSDANGKLLVQSLRWKLERLVCSFFRGFLLFGKAICYEVFQERLRLYTLKALGNGVLSRNIPPDPKALSSNETLQAHCSTAFLPSNAEKYSIFRFLCNFLRS